MNTDKHGFWKLQVGGGILDVELIISVAQDHVLRDQPGDLVLVRVNPCPSVVAFQVSLPG